MPESLSSYRVTSGAVLRAYCDQSDFWRARRLSKGSPKGRELRLHDQHPIQYLDTKAQVSSPGGHQSVCVVKRHDWVQPLWKTVWNLLKTLKMALASVAQWIACQPATQACALIRNETSDPLFCRRALNPLSHTSQGKFF